MVQECLLEKATFELRAGGGETQPCGKQPLSRSHSLSLPLPPSHVLAGSSFSPSQTCLPPFPHPIPRQNVGAEGTKSAKALWQDPAEPV